MPLRGWKVDGLIGEDQSCYATSREAEKIANDGEGLIWGKLQRKEAEMGRKPVNWNSLDVRVVEGKFCKPEQSDI